LGREEKMKKRIAFAGVVFAITGVMLIYLIFFKDKESQIPTPQATEQSVLVLPTPQQSAPEILVPTNKIPAATKIITPTKIPAQNTQVVSGEKIPPPYNNVTLPPGSEWTVIIIDKLAWHNKGYVYDVATFADGKGRFFLAHCAEPGWKSPKEGVTTYRLNTWGVLAPINEDPTDRFQRFIVMNWVFLK
jgi:hypothetical protein